MTTLRVLIIEDSDDDCALLLRELKRGGFELVHERVETAEALDAALAREWDIIFSDFSMPRFNGTQALEMVRARHPDVPFVFVSGTIGEDIAVAAMKAGARDYIMKGNLMRLLPTVRRELREVELKRERARIEQERRTTEERFRNILAIAADAVISVDETQRIQIFNHGAERIFGYDASEMIGQSLDRLLPERVVEAHRAHVAGFATSPEHSRRMGERREVFGRRKDGSEFPAEASISKLVEQGKITFTVILRDISERRRAEQELRLLQTITMAVSEVPDLDSALAVALNKVCAATGWPFGQAWLPTSDRCLRASGAWVGGGPFEPFRRKSHSLCFKPGQGLPGRALEARKPLRSDTPDDDASCPRARIAQAANVKAAVAIPVLAGDEVVAVLEFLETTPDNNDERLIALVSAVASQIGVVIQRKRYEERLHYLAHHDVLTGLPNRVRFAERLKEATAEARRRGRFVGVAFLDLDRFKTINDSLGHEVGDTLLKRVAERLTAAVRPGDTVARLAGDEFALVLADIGHASDVENVVRKILSSFSKPFPVGADELFVSASVGVTLFPADNEDADALLGHADVAMYRAKESGRNTYQFYRAEMISKATENLALENDLRRVLERDQLRLHYQPQIDAERGEIVGIEALLRWQHPERGMISPAQFIPLAEETGLIVPIGEWVLRTACAQARRWLESGLPRARMAVNLSTRQFRQTDLVQGVLDALRVTGFDASLLELEITESVLVRDPDDAAAKLRELSSFGVHVALDDFGTGYSSLSYLKRFPVDVLKIDQSFVRDIKTDPDDAAIASAIIAMARSLKLDVIAEGVENEEQLVFLRNSGCRVMQGYYFSRPLPANELVGFWRKHLPRS